MPPLTGLGGSWGWGATKIPRLRRSMRHVGSYEVLQPRRRARSDAPYQRRAGVAFEGLSRRDGVRIAHGFNRG